ncbi:diacylglycerol kinase [Heracleum sosnowskyi]|uniref:Diacylglycerol kinase n=1 Tax=Heracleum sosnowskyi TaxID=360622 RepID=A0AAD8IWV1_9APIA|nr:diacylglycerol kinase [Heracleum sosnowskyi]
MESPTADDLRAPRVAVRSSLIDSIKACTFAGAQIPKELLRSKISMPQHLRFAIRDAVRYKSVDAGMSHFRDAVVVDPPESPVVVFISSKSGGRYGPKLMTRLQELMSEEQVLDLSHVKPNDFVQYGLGCLEKFAAHGDTCARETREKLRVVVAGGDGTVGWVLSCLGELHKQGREPVPPTGIIPLGTGNDLSRSFGWGGSFPYNWKSGIKRTLDKAAGGQISHLDSWNLRILMSAGEEINAPHCLKRQAVEDFTLDQEMEDKRDLPEKVSCYEGVFYNYFSIGMDAQIAYGFHHLRNEKPYLAQGPVSNKIIYSCFTCTQGWFFTPCIADPGLRGLNNILRMYIKRVNCSEWEQIHFPSSVRSIVVLNLHNYGSGRNPWGHPNPKYMKKKGFVEAHTDDGILEVFGLKQGWHTSVVMVELITAKHLAQAAGLRFEFRGGEWRKSYMQMDGEPWKQPLNNAYSTFVEINRVPNQSVMITGE